MKKLTIKIEMENAVFENITDGYAISDCLDQVRRKIINGHIASPIFDINGNNVGSYRITNR